MRARLTALALGAALGLPMDALAGAWTRPPGEVYAHAGLSLLLEDDTHFDADGRKASELGASYRERAATLDAEVGIIDRVTGLLRFAYWSVDLDAPRRDGRGDTQYALPGQAGLGARVRLLEAPLLLSLQGEGRLALKRSEDPAPHRWGDGRDEARLVGVASRGFDNAWLSAEVGALLRAELPANQFVYVAQAGHWFGPVALEAGFDGAQSLADAPSDPTLGGQYGDVTNPLVDTVAADSAHRFGLKTIVRPVRWIEVDAGFLLTYAGRSTTSAPRFNVGVAVIF